MQLSLVHCIWIKIVLLIVSSTAESQKWTSMHQEEQEKEKKVNVFSLNTSDKQASNNLVQPSLVTKLIPGVTTKCPRQMDCFCGLSSVVKSVNTRIVGGHEATPHSLPWMVSLVDEDFETFCGGVLINDRYILTAAHCTPAIDLETTRLILGHHDMSALGGEARIYSIDKVIAHEKYQETDPNQRYDIALVKVKGGVVTYDEYISPICLPSRWTPSNNFSSLHVAGWGQLGDNRLPSDVLMEASVPEMQMSKCIKLLRSDRVTPDHICAGNKTRDTCTGDSGGPLMLPPYINPQTGNLFPAYTSIGLVSWGISCANPVFPGVFTRVWSYAQWIMDHTPDGNYCNNKRPYSRARHIVC